MSLLSAAKNLLPGAPGSRSFATLRMTYCGAIWGIPARRDAQPPSLEVFYRGDLSPFSRGHFKTGALIVVILSAAKNLGFRGGEILRFAQDDRFEMPSSSSTVQLLGNQRVEINDLPVLAVGKPSMKLQLDVVSDHLDRSVAENALETGRVGTAEPPPLFREAVHTRGIADRRVVARPTRIVSIADVEAFPVPPALCIEVAFHTQVLLTHQVGLARTVGDVAGADITSRENDARQLGRVRPWPGRIGTLGVGPRFTVVLPELDSFLAARVGRIVGAPCEVEIHVRVVTGSVVVRRRVGKRLRTAAARAVEYGNRCCTPLGKGIPSVEAAGSFTQLAHDALFHELEDIECPAAGLRFVGAQFRLAYPVLPPATGRKPVVAAMVRQESNPQLLEIVRTACASGGFARRLHGRQKKGDQDADDGNHHQKLDQGKRQSLRRLSKNVFEKGATAGLSSSAGHGILPKTRADKPPMAPSTEQKTALQARSKEHHAIENSPMVTRHRIVITKRGAPVPLCGAPPSMCDRRYRRRQSNKPNTAETSSMSVLGSGTLPALAPSAAAGPRTV